MDTDGQQQGADGASMEDAGSYHVTLKGGGLALDREVNEQQAWAVLAVVFEQQHAGHVTGVPRRQHDPRAGTQDQKEQSWGEQGAPNEPHTTLSVGEFLEQCHAKRNPDKITAIGVYLQDHGGISKFTREDVKQQFPKAGERIPGNHSRDFRVAVSSKWLSESEDGPGYYVTNAGRTAVNQKFPAEVRRTFSSTSGRKRNSAKKKLTDGD